MPITYGPNLGLMVDGAQRAEHYLPLMKMLRGVDCLVQGHVKSVTTSVPPGAPADGDAYIVAAGGSGAWAGKDGQVARFSSVVAAWEFYPPHAGWGMHNESDGHRYRYNGAGWSRTAAMLDFSTSTTLAENSDVLVATQKAVKAYVDSSVAGLLDLKGGTDCSANPNYPAALKGDCYYVTVAGKIGGAAGTIVDVGDVITASADNAGGTQAAVGASWFVIEHNFTNAVIQGLLTGSGLTMNTARVLGRTTAGSGAIEELTAAALGTFLGQANVKPYQVMGPIAVGDESTAITAAAGTAKITYHAWYDFTLTEIFAGLSTQQATGSLLTVDVKKNGVSIFTTKITIDNAEDTSLTAATPAALTAATIAIAKGDKITIEVTQVGDGTAKGLKVYPIGYRT